MWVPFENRFNQLLQRMGYHRQIFEQEMKIQDQAMLNRLEEGQKKLNDLYDTLQLSLDVALRTFEEVYASDGFMRASRDAGTRSTVSKTTVLIGI